MQKSKIATIIMISLIAVFAIFAQLFLRGQKIYLYAINPAFWIVLAIFLGISIKTYTKRKFKKEIIHYAITAALIYIIISLVSGLLVTFGNNPYNTSLRGVITNLWIFGVPIVLREFVRYKLINNVNEKDKFKVGVFLIIVFTMVETSAALFSGISRGSGYFLFKQIASVVLPSAVKNILFTYIAVYSNPAGAIIYEISTKLFLWISPILPNSQWIMSAFIDITIPVVLFLYVRYSVHKKDIYGNRKDLIYLDPKSLLPMFAVIIVAIWFAVGMFPIKPVAVATGSMYPDLKVGTVAIVQKCDAEDVKVNDIIEYRTDTVNVVHRVIEIKRENGKLYFVTKGDNNNNKDDKLVDESNVIGKVKAKIPFLGYPAVWINMAKKE